jgi:lipopolysaccharide/colanic/teichoic acid biosynthesis glycosyltransferase
MEARVACDVYYAENWSLLFDLRILIMTGIVVFFQKTAY